MTDGKPSAALRVWSISTLRSVVCESSDARTQLAIACVNRASLESAALCIWGAPFLKEEKAQTRLAHVAHQIEIISWKLRIDGAAVRVKLQSAKGLRQINEVALSDGYRCPLVLPSGWAVERIELGHSRPNHDNASECAKLWQPDTADRYTFVAIRATYPFSSDELNIIERASSRGDGHRVSKLELIFPRARTSAGTSWRAHDVPSIIGRITADIESLTIDFQGQSFSDSLILLQACRTLANDNLHLRIHTSPPTLSEIQRLSGSPMSTFAKRRYRETTRVSIYVDYGYDIHEDSQKRMARLLTDKKWAAHMGHASAAVGGGAGGCSIDHLAYGDVAAASLEQWRAHRDLDQTADRLLARDFDQAVRTYREADQCDIGWQLVPRTE